MYTLPQYSLREGVGSVIPLAHLAQEGVESQYTRLSVRVCVYKLINSVCLSVCLFTCLFVCLFVCFYVG